MASVSESASRSSSGADSYIGCLISLTSKSEIRYEGVLYDINTDESSIGLRNVRSFGTEGRKKDGQQVPPGDKIYEYILFRGSDIKDLQVKSSPPLPQPTPPINNDPAIIQSHYPRPPTVSAGLPSAGSGSLTDLNSLPPQLGHPGSNFQGALPLYQPGGSIGSWGASPAPGANGGGLAMPMYWQGYYGAPNGLPSLPQQSLLRPPPGLPIPSSMQQQMHYPNLNPSLSSGTSNLPDFPPSLIPSTTSTSSLVVGSISLQPPNLPLTLPPVPSATLTSETLPASAPIKAPTILLPAGPPPANLSSLPFTSSSEINAVVPPVPNKPNAIPAPSLPYQAVSQSSHGVTGSSNSIPTEPLQPSLVTPGQLLQSGPSMVSSSSQSSQTAQKDAKVIQKSLVSLPDPASPVSAEAQPPILPLPVTSRTTHRPSGALVQNYGYGYRGHGRGRGIGSSRPVTKFTEDFDFTAMNEKFKKDEVWGHLGKSNKSHSKEKDGDENVSEEEDIEDEDNCEALKLEIKPVYNKDDFFDTLSSNALDNDSQIGRIRYSEQLKLDTETFGDFMRHRGGRGGRGPMRGGRSRGGYNGRGYGGYAGRGRGRGMVNRT